MSKLSRDKGRAYEQFVARALRVVYPNAKRGIGQSRAAGEVPDVDGAPWWVECKHKRGVNVHAAHAQAIKARAECSDPKLQTLPVLVVHRTQRGSDMVSMELDVFIALMEELNDGRKA